MGAVKFLKEIQSGNGVKWIGCDTCGMFCPAGDAKREITPDEKTVEFECDRCGRIKQLEEQLKKFLEEKVVVTEEENVSRKDVSTDCGDLVEVLENTEDSTKGVILGDSMVRFIADEVGRSKRNMARCCLPGAKVKDVIEAVRNGAVSKDDKTVLWIGTNDVESSKNGSFTEEVTTLIDEIKKETKDIQVLGLLPRYGVYNGWMNQRVKVMNSIIRTVCSESNVRFVDTWKICKREWVRPDGIHLSRTGNQEVSRVILTSWEAKN